jgi:hypothetical protein
MGEGGEKNNKKDYVCVKMLKRWGRVLQLPKKMRRKGGRIHSWQWWVELLMVNV